MNERLERLGEKAFSGNAIRSIRLPPTLKRIEAETFSWCENLKSVEIPSGVEYIGKNCFKNSGIEEITLPGTLREIDKDTFKDS